MLRVGQALQGRVGEASRVGCNLSIQQSVFVCVCVCVCVGGGYVLYPQYDDGGDAKL